MFLGGGYDRQRTLAIRIAAITLASDSAIIIARFRPSKVAVHVAVRESVCTRAHACARVRARVRALSACMLACILAFCVWECMCVCGFWDVVL